MTREIRDSIMAEFEARAKVDVVEVLAQFFREHAGDEDKYDNIQLYAEIFFGKEFGALLCDNILVSRAGNDPELREEYLLVGYPEIEDHYIQAAYDKYFFEKFDWSLLEDCW